MILQERIECWEKQLVDLSDSRLVCSPADDTLRATPTAKSGLCRPPSFLGSNS